MRKQVKTKVRMKKEEKTVSIADEILNQLEINETDIIGETKKQVRLMGRLSVLLAEAQRNSARTAENVKRVRSELILEAYISPTKIGEGVNLTAANVEAWYRSQKRYIEAKQENIEAEYDASILQSLMYTLAHRRSGIEIMAHARSQEDGDISFENRMTDYSYARDPVHPRSAHVPVQKELRQKKLKAITKKTKQKIKERKIQTGDTE